MSEGMSMRLLKVGLMGLMLAAGGRAMAQEVKPLYEMNFEKVEAGKLPDDFLPLDGAFEVKAEDGNKFLELPGTPLDTYGMLFGPAVKSDVAVTVRVRGTKHGRQYPTFAVGLNGQSGYRLQVSPGKKA